MGVPMTALPWAPKSESVCRFVMKELPTVKLAKLPTVKEGPVTVTLQNLSIPLGSSAEKKEFDVCGFMNDVHLQNTTGKLRLTMTIPSIAFRLDHWHFTMSITHGSGTADGHLATHIEVPFAYDLSKPSLNCEDFVMTVPSVGLALHGGGAWHPIVADLTKSIKKAIQAQVPAIGKQEVCPLLNKVLDAHFNKCFAPGKTWMEILICCLKGQNQMVLTPDSLLIV